MSTRGQKRELRFVDIAAWSDEDLGRLSKVESAAERERLSMELSRPAADVSVEEVTRVTPMPFYLEAIAVLTFGLGVPGFGIVFPVLLVALYLWRGAAAVAMAAAAAAPLAFLPYRFSDDNLKLPRYRALLKYFSFKGVYTAGHCPWVKGKPYILVAPPHGVFPYGNLATMVAWPALTGYSFNGLAASAAFRAPVFRQILGGMGAIDAGRRSAGAALAAGRTVGISSGGVAEVFETNNAAGQEAIVLRNRKGLVKLALRHGADIVPCYLYGNNAALSVWYDPFGLLRGLSRRLGFALIFFWGRWGLPVPYRTPILGAVGVPIAVPQPPGGEKEEPSQEDIDLYHNKLLEGMAELFEATKGLYGWQHKELVIR